MNTPNGEEADAALCDFLVFYGLTTCGSRLLGIEITKHQSGHRHHGGHDLDESLHHGQTHNQPGSQHGRTGRSGGNRIRTSRVQGLMLGRCSGNTG